MSRSEGGGAREGAALAIQEVAAVKKVGLRGACVCEREREMCTGFEVNGHWADLGG
jgi:hypothetical protein